MGRKQHRCHGDPRRFEVVADFIHNRYGNTIRYIADVAGGQGCLTRLLNKKFNYESEVIDPRGYALKGVPNRQVAYTPDMADYYNLIVGLHPDEATRQVVESARYKPIIVIPCCNFWDQSVKLGSEALIAAIAEYIASLGVCYEIVKFEFSGPKNMGIVTFPC